MDWQRPRKAAKQVSDGTGAIMTGISSLSMTRRGVLGAFAATAVTAAPTFANASGFLKGSGDIRRLRMTSPRTGEKIDMIYWIEGNYIKDAVREIESFMRDWRTSDVHRIDTRTIDIMAASPQPAGFARTLHAAVWLSQPENQCDAAQPLARGRQEFAPHARPGRRSAPRLALGQPDVPRRCRLSWRWCRSVFRL